MTDISALASVLIPGNQYIRKISLIVYGTPPVPTGTGIAVPSAPATVPTTPSPLTIAITPKAPAAPTSQPGLDLSNLRIQFHVDAMDVDQPPTATIRVLNLADTTASQIQKEFQNVVLQAGYQNGNFGVIFKGNIIRTRKGRLGSVETFFDIYASNLDALYNFGVVSTTVKAGANRTAVVNAITSSVNASPVAQGSAGAQQQGMQLGYIPSNFGTGGTLPRGKVMFGLWRNYMNDTTASAGCTWQIASDGTIKIIPLTGYLPNQAVVINSQTGMIGIPEATPQGIEVRCLLNPSIVPGQKIQLDNASITQTLNNAGNIGFPAYSDYQFFANTSTDGIYRAIVVEHEGDTRGEDEAWLTKIVALSLDQASGSVAAYG